MKKFLYGALALALATFLPSAVAEGFAKRPAVSLERYNVGPLPVQNRAVTFGLVVSDQGKVRLAQRNEKAQVRATVDLDATGSVNICGYVQVLRRYVQGKATVKAQLVGAPYFCAPGALPPKLP